jgi:hypothetical protein
MHLLVFLTRFLSIDAFMSSVSHFLVVSNGRDAELALSRSLLLLSCQLSFYSCSLHFRRTFLFFITTTLPIVTRHTSSFPYNYPSIHIILLFCSLEESTKEKDERRNTSECNRYLVQKKRKR